MPLTMDLATVAQVVKKETSLLHEEVEAMLLPQLQHLRSRSDYAQLLHMFYGFFQPVQQAIRSQLDSGQLPDIEKRRTADLILSDLLVLGDSSAPVLCSSIPVIQTTQQAFGALYVLEGSTLGGKMIARMLAKNTAANIPGDAFRFFSGYGEETGFMWTSFLSVLNRQADVEAITGTANQTFLSLKHWMHAFYGAANQL